MRFSVDGMWRQTSGLSHTQLANHILHGGYWAKYGTQNRALCKKCNSVEGGDPVEVTLWSLPECTLCFDAAAHPKEVFTFDVAPKCSSSRSHIRSKIAFLISTVPGIDTITSNPISLCSRNRRWNPPHSFTPEQQMVLINCSKWPSEERAENPISLLNELSCRSVLKPLADPPNYSHQRTSLTQVSELVSLRSTSDRQTFLDSRSSPKLPESTVAAIPERILRRPAVIVTIMHVQEQNFDTLFNALSAYQGPLDFVIKYTKISSNLYVLTGKHKSVENFCYGNQCLSGFVRGDNPFHIDLTQPNPIVTFIGWANNTFSQIV